MFQWLSWKLLRTIHCKDLALMIIFEILALEPHEGILQSSYHLL